MGRMVDGVWHSEEVMEMDRSGAWLRPETRFRNWLNKGDFATEAGRYHLYVALNCPWAHRTIIYRKLKQLEDIVSLSFVLPRRTAEGWVFDPDEETYRDPVLGKQCLHEVYSLADADFSGRVTVPVLWDRHQGTIVNNESAEILRMFDAAFDDAGAGGPALYPASLRDEIDAVNARVYTQVNNGVYRAGFATSQAAYEEAVSTLFAALDWLEDRLGHKRYLAGESITEADWRLFTTLARFDAVYVGHFKCNRRRLVDYQHLWAFTRELYQVPGVAETVNLDHIKRHYYMSHTGINPTRIVPKGPEIDFLEPHGRDGPPDAEGA